MKSIASLFALATLTVCYAAAADPVGIRDIEIAVPERNGTIVVTVWYPAGSGGTPVLVGDNGVFTGVTANRDAPVAGRHHPLILLSHGGFRAAPHADSWIAARLARDGYVVASVRASSRELKADDAPRDLASSGGLVGCPDGAGAEPGLRACD